MPTFDQSINTRLTTDGDILTRSAGAPARLTRASLAADAAFTGTYVKEIFPESYGAGGLGLTNDTTAVQAALDAVPATGGVVRLRGRYFCPTGVTVSQPTKIIGLGTANIVSLSQQTGFITDSATATALTVASPGCVLEDFAVVNIATTPTAGAGINLTAGNGTRLRGMVVSKFWTNVEVSTGFYWHMDDCTLLDPMKYGVHLHNLTPNGDWGDGVIANSNIVCLNTTRTPDAAVRWDSGGGLRFVGNKINGGTAPDGVAAAGTFAYGIDLQIVDGQATGVFQMTGNSVENLRTAGVRLGLAGTTGFFQSVNIVGNEFGVNRGTYVGVIANGGSTGHMRDIDISHNVFYDIDGGVSLAYVDGVTVGPNTYETLGGPAVVLGTNCFAVQVSPQNVRDDGLDLFTSTTAAQMSGSTLQQGNIDHTYVRELPAGITSTTTYVTLYRLTWATYSCGYLDVEIDGQGTGVGSGLGKVRRAVTRESGSVVLATDGTDLVGGPASMGTGFDLLLDTTSVAGEVQVKIRLNATAGATQLYGLCTVKASGPLSKVHKGA